MEASKKLLQISPDKLRDRRGRYGRGFSAKRSVTQSN
jgi:hypothetical protein